VCAPGRPSRLEPLLREQADDFVSGDVTERELLVRVHAALRVRRYMAELSRKNAELEAVSRRLEPMGRRTADELRLAASVQRSLLPVTTPHPRLELAREF